MLFANVVFDFFGDLERESYFIVMKGQKAHVLATVRSAMGGSVELASGRLVPLNSAEFRREFVRTEAPASAPKRDVPAAVDFNWRCCRTCTGFDDFVWERGWASPSG